MAKKESKKETPQPVQPVQPPKVDFEAWWAMVSKKLPPHHRKEVVMADFKARGISTKETLSAFNNALEKYGVKLK